MVDPVSVRGTEISVAKGHLCALSHQPPRHVFELPLIICHCYLSKPGLQAVYITSLLHHLWAMSFSSSKCISFQLKGVALVYLDLRKNKELSEGNFLYATMSYNGKILNVPQNLSLGQNTATTFNTKTTNHCQ